MPRLTASDLRDNHQFNLHAELDHKQIATFAQEYFWKRRSWIPFLLNLLMALIVALMIIVARKGGYGFDRAISQFGFAVITAFVVLLPLHEAIHAFVYRLQGCRDIRWSYSWRGFTVYVTANQFVVNAREFFCVAVMPFLVLNLALLVAAVAYTPLRFYFLAMLLVHTAASSGDWALINYFWLNREKEIYTFDDVPVGKSYFYTRATHQLD